MDDRFLNLELITKHIFNGIRIKDIMKQLKERGNYKDLTTVALNIWELQKIERAYGLMRERSRSKEKLEIEKTELINLEVDKKLIKTNKELKNLLN